MAITYVGGVAGAGAITDPLTLPAQTAHGDLVLWFAYASSVPSGYTLGNVGSPWIVGYKFMGQVPDTTVPTNPQGVVALVFRGVDQSSPLDSALPNWAFNNDAPAVTTVTDGAMLVALCGRTTLSGDWSAVPSGFDAGAALEATSSNFPLATAYQEAGAAGSYDPGTFSHSAQSGSYRAQTVALRPAPHGPGFPQVQARETGRTTGTNTTSHAIALPSGIQAGELLLVLFTTDGAPTITVDTGVSGTGWTLETPRVRGTAVTGQIAWKIGEGSDALTLTTSASEQSSHVAFRISGADSTAPVSFTAADSFTTAANPPSHTPPGGAADYLWIAVRGGDNINSPATAPTDYGFLTNSAAAGSGGASTSTAERLLNAASEDPVAFSATNSRAFVTFTIAVAPAPAASGATINVPAADIAVAGAAPTVSTGASVAVPAAALTLAALAPTIQTAAPALIDVPAAGITVAALAPAVSTGAAVAVPAAAVALAGIAPSVATGVLVPVPAAGVTLAAVAPEVSAGAAFVIYNETISDSVTPGDAWVTTATLVLSFSDGLTAGESVLAQRAVNATMEETSTAQDAMNVGTAITAVIAETLTLGDVMAPTLQVPVTIVESVTPSDTMGMSAAFATTLTEALTLADGFGAEAVVSVTVTDNATPGDSFIGDIDMGLGGPDPWKQIGGILRDVPEDVLLENPAELLRLLRMMVRAKRR